MCNSDKYLGTFFSCLELQKLSLKIIWLKDTKAVSTHKFHVMEVTLHILTSALDGGEFMSFPFQSSFE
jgi:hypothetical protein